MSQSKLVRDQIPQIIREEGLEPIVCVAGAEEYRASLKTKLHEEVQEFLDSNDAPGELADILEMLYALAEDSGIDRERLEKLRAAKAEECGAFSGRIIWCGNQPHGIDSADQATSNKLDRG